MAQQGKLSITENGEVTIVKFCDVAILDETTIKEPADEILAIAQSKDAVKLVVNFETVDYVSSAVLGRMVQIYKTVRKKKGKIALCCLVPSIQQVFKITKLDKMFPILPDEAKAVKKVGQAAKKRGMGLFGGSK